jgi:hypothetical protein
VRAGQAWHRRRADRNGNLNAVRSDGADSASALTKPVAKAVCLVLALQGSER